MPICLLIACLVPCLDVPQVPQQPAPGFEVVVRDGAGKALRGAPIGIGRPGKDVRFEPTGMVTDKQGCCRIVVDPAQGLGRDVVVAVLGAFHHPFTAAVDTLQPPAVPVELVVPASGQVRFILYGRDGRPLAGLREARLALVGEDRSVAALELAADNALFPWVELGQEVVVTARCDAVAGPMRFRSDGPVRAGEFRIVEGRLGQGAALASLVVLDADGHPVADEDVGVLLCGDGVRVQVEQRTAPDGGLLVALGDSRAAARTLRVLRCGADAVHAAGGAVVGPFDAPATGVLDLGAVRCVAEPLVLTGRVVDAAGHPIAGVRLRAPRTVASRSDLSAFLHRVTTDADGAFVLHELQPEAGELQFEVEGAAWGAAVPLRARPDGRPPVFVLQPKGTLAFAFAGDRNGLGFDVHLLQRETGRSEYAHLTNGEFGPLAVLAGTYDVTIGDHGVEFTIREVVVPAGGAADDARLLAVEPGPGLQIVRASVVDDRGEPVAGLPVWWRTAPDAQVGRGATTDAQGRVVFLAARAQGFVAVQELGFEPLVQPADTELALRVQRVPPVVVHVDGLPALPAGLRWTLNFVAAAPAKAASGRVVVENGVARFQPERLGTWRLLVGADGPRVRDLQTARRVSELQKGLRMEFAVEALAAPAAGPQTVTLTKDQRATLEQHAEALREVLGDK